MSQNDIDALMQQIEGLSKGLQDVGSRLTKVEEAVVTVMAKALKYDWVLGWLKLAGVLLLGIAIGLGMIRLNDLIGLVK